MAASDRPPRSPQDVYMRLEFHNFLDEIPDSSKNYMMIMEPEEYESVMQEVKRLKRKKTPNVDQIRYLQCYNMKIVGIRERLFMPKALAGFPQFDRYFAHTDEVFDILYDIHETTKHSSKHLMERIIDRKYVNITHEMVNSFVKLCRKCQRKKQTAKMRQTLKTMFKFQMMRRGEVHLLDIRRFKDKQYEYMVCYRDNITNFMLLRAMKGSCITEVANILLDFFSMFGAPSVLQSPHGRPFIHDVVLSMISVWPNLVISHSEMMTTEINTRANKIRFESIYKFMDTWLTTHAGASVYQAARYAQMVINMAPCVVGTTTAYELMFNRRMKFGITAELRQLLPPGIHTQEAMEAFIETWRPLD